MCVGPIYVVPRSSPGESFTAVRPTPEYRELSRLNLDEIVHQGRKALDEEDWDQATPLLREAVRRAPFRQDFRDMLALAIEGSIANSDNTRFSLPITEPPMSPPEQIDLQAEKTMMLSADTLNVREPVEPPLFRSGRRASPTVAIPLPRAKDMRRRHRRGPASAILLGLTVGLVMILIAGGVAWVYLDQISRTSAREGTSPGLPPSEVQTILIQANVYRQKGEYSKAIERLLSLPPFTRRDRMLTSIYMDHGDNYLMQKPPLFKRAIEAYREAVKHQPQNTDYVNALGQTFFTLALTVIDDKDSYARYLQQARETFEVVRKQDPENLKALSNLAKVGTHQRDQELQVNSYRMIVEIDPDGDLGRDARRNLESLGFKY